ncbi:M1 family metallopeptidase [Kribbella sp. NBC_00382]|uniref:M1 family metallopeptidase n=1 Tax=Kribbella sp. NBC_00382 TaxID=2975967 RepID=UPI002E1D5D36
MATKMMTRAGSLLAATVLLVPVGVVSAQAAAAPGAGDLGDRLFPGLGNGGYDAQSYDVSLGYEVGTTKMPGVVTMRAVATQSLTRFSVDSAGQRIEAVTVNGRPAEYRLVGEKLSITPRSTLYKHLPFTVRVVYTADRSQNPVPPGLNLPPGVPNPFTVWNETPDGFGVMGQPNRAHVVFPSNDHPSDKAQYTIRITTPNDRTGIASGRRTAKYKHGQTTTWVYKTAHPIKTDVVAIAVGKFREIKQTGPHGLPIRSYLGLAKFQGKSYTDAMQANAIETPQQLAWLEKQIGRPFPYEQYGVLGLTSPYDGVALETAGLSTFGLPLSLPAKDEAGTLVHELTHQYFGDAVSVRSWDDMWISEGHARYYERKYDASRGFTNLNAELKDLYETDQQSRHDSGPMGRLNSQLAVLFDTDVPGQLMLTGLNSIVGEQTFRRIEQTFFDRYRDRSAGTQDYIDTANEVSGRDLTQYFCAWIYGKTTPPMPGHPDWHSTPAKAA